MRMTVFCIFLERWCPRLESKAFDFFGIRHIHDDDRIADGGHSHED